MVLWGRITGAVVLVVLLLIGCGDTHGPSYKSADDRLTGYWLAEGLDEAATPVPSVSGIEICDSGDVIRLMVNWETGVLWNSGKNSSTAPDHGPSLVSPAPPCKLISDRVGYATLRCGGSGPGTEIRYTLINDQLEFSRPVGGQTRYRRAPDGNQIFAPVIALFEATFNGGSFENTAFTPSKISRYLSAYSIINTRQNEEHSFRIHAGNGWESLNLNIPEWTGAGTYSIEPGHNLVYYYCFDACVGLHQRQSGPSGSVTIDEYDAVEGRCTGTFALTMVEIDWQAPIVSIDVEITGQFDLPVYIYPQ